VVVIKNNIFIMKHELKRGKIFEKIPNDLKDSYTNFMEGIKNRMTNKKYKAELQKIIKALKINYQYKDTVDAVDDILNNINKLLVQFGFVDSIADTKINNKSNKIKISSFAGGRLDTIQLKPYKNGVALVIFTEKREENKRKNKEEVGITIRPVAAEDEQGKILGNESGMIIDKEEDAWRNVSGGVAKQL
jgi:maltooligosyltrehalose synthase